MKIVASLVLAVLSVHVNAAGFTNCADLSDAIADTQNGLNRGYDYCKIYMGLTPITRTTTIDSIRATRTVTTANYNTQRITVTPADSTSTRTVRTTTVVTTVPATRTALRTITSTAYILNDGATYKIAKRDAIETSAAHLEARARPLTIPSYMTGFTSRERQLACRCINAPRPTIMRSITRGIYATVTKNIGRQIKITTTLPVQVIPTTQVNVLTKVVKAASPFVRQDVVEFDQVRGCPPDEATLFQCPEGTGLDDMSDPNYQTCAVNALDGFSGSCVFWNDDGSPVESILTRGDGSGNADNDEQRSATYGDGEEDDCPTWADYTCQPAGTPLRKRSLTSRARKPKPKKNFGSSRKNHGKLRKLPQVKPQRGANFVTYAEYLQNRLEAQAQRAASQ